MSLPSLPPWLSSLAAAALLLCPAFGQTTTRISVDSTGVQAGRDSNYPSISADGRFVAFGSHASLVPGDTNGRWDVYLYDRQTDQVRRVSVDSAGMQVHGDSEGPSISADGRFVAFESTASTLVPGDTNGWTDVFVHDSMTGQTSRVSVDSLGTQGNSSSYDPDISADGRFVKFSSFSDNLTPGITNRRTDTFVHDTRTGRTMCVNVDSSGVLGNDYSGGGAISADGRFVAFVSYADNLILGDLNGEPDVFVHDLLTGETACTSVDSTGALADTGDGQGSRGVSISADGRCVAFFSGATNLVPGDTNGLTDVFVHDRLTGKTSRVSVDSAGAQANGGSTIYIQISANGRYVAFSSSASNLVAGDTNDASDVFVHDRATGVTERVSVDSAGLEGNRASYTSSLSTDGRFVAFTSRATNLVPGDSNGKLDIFLRDRGAINPSFAKSGTCPGAITLDVRDATPLGTVLIFHGPAGTFVNPGQRCPGIVLNLGAPALGANITADASGNASRTVNAPSGACGLHVQAVDVTTCTATNIVVL